MRAVREMFSVSLTERREIKREGGRSGVEKEDG